MPTLYMLVGVPGSGKSTWIANQPFDWNRTVVASTDNYIDRKAKEVNKTYNDVFQQEIDNATNNMKASVADAIENGYDIVWDQTSPSKKSRRFKLHSVPDSYKKVAVFFPTPDEKELMKRLGNRPGKNIPDHVMKSMIDNLEIPSREEGFDDVIILK